MRVEFLVDEAGQNSEINWSYKKGEIVDIADLPSGDASAYRWQGMNVLQILRAEPGANVQSGLSAPNPETESQTKVEPEKAASSGEGASPAGKAAPGSDAGETSTPKRGRGRPTTSEVEARKAAEAKA